MCNEREDERAVPIYNFMLHQVVGAQALCSVREQEGKPGFPLPTEAWLDAAGGVSLHEADYTQACSRQGLIAYPCMLFNFYVFPCDKNDNVHVQEGQPGFPLPAEAWLDELLASIFRMLINLESTDAKGKDHITFLMNDSSLYRQARLLCVVVWWNHKPIKEASSSLGDWRAPGASHVG